MHNRIEFSFHERRRDIKGEWAMRKRGLKRAANTCVIATATSAADLFDARYKYDLNTPDHVCGVPWKGKYVYVPLEPGGNLWWSLAANGNPEEAARVALNKPPSEELRMLLKLFTQFVSVPEELHPETQRFVIDNARLERGALESMRALRHYVGYSGHANRDAPDVPDVPDVPGVPGVLNVRPPYPFDIKALW